MSIIEAVGEVVGGVIGNHVGEVVMPAVQKKTGWPAWLITFGCGVIFILGIIIMFNTLIYVNEYVKR